MTTQVGMREESAARSRAASRPRVSGPVLQRERGRHRDRDVTVLVAEPLVDGAHAVVAALRPGDDFA
mgnify:CR=1 FL=1